MIGRILCFLGLAAVVLPALAPARGQGEPPPPTVITIRPAAAPVPALKYRLLHERRELVPGNAAIFYHRAIEMVMETRNRLMVQAQRRKPSPTAAPSGDDSITSWLNGPLNAIPCDEARKQLDMYQEALREIDLGARRATCDWEFEHRTEGFQLNIREIQEARSLARLVALRTRLQILEGRADEAIHSLQTGFALARHVSQAPNFIASLVGSAIVTHMTSPLEDLVQAPGTPSLYWAIASLPRPFIDLLPSLEEERYILEREFPGLRNIDGAPWSLDQARSFSDELRQKGATLFDKWGRPSGSSTQPTMADLASHLQFTGLVARSYPEAKRYLLAQDKPAAAVEAMPAIQAVALHAFKIYEQRRDDLFKWAALPYWQSAKGMARAERQCFQGNTGGLPFVNIIPASRSVFVATVRIDRRLNVVQTVEAIRLYAAAHEGSLPPSLEALTDAPAPADPATGKPFDYKAEGPNATLAAPPPPGWERVPSFQVRYELKLAK